LARPLRWKDSRLIGSSHDVLRLLGKRLKPTSGSPETLTNLERKSWKTAFLKANSENIQIVAGYKTSTVGGLHYAHQVFLGRFGELITLTSG
jgi:hypothetical protein